MDTLKFERDVSLQTEDTLHDNSSQTEQQQWIDQLLIQMNQRLDEIESLTITTENIINGKNYLFKKHFMPSLKRCEKLHFIFILVLQILDEMKNELIDIDDETSELRDVQDRISHLHSQIIQSQCCEELVEMIIRLDDRITMIKFLSLIDENSLFYKKLKSALEKSEAEVSPESFKLFKNIILTLKNIHLHIFCDPWLYLPDLKFELLMDHICSLFF